LPHVLNLGFDGLDSEAVMLAWKGVVAVSNGSACTSHSYTPSHVLLGMGMDRARVDEALRLSWSYLTELPDVEAMVAGVAGLR
jgi:cysteine desulfurase